MTDTDPVVAPAAAPTVSVERIDGKVRAGDLHDLCDATEAAILDGGGFGWVVPPPREIIERFWRGVLVVPERTLFVARLDGVIAGSVQLARPSRNNEAQAHACRLTTAFVAPWARGYGVARTLTLRAEHEARGLGFHILNLEVRGTQQAALAMYESLGFRHWGTHPCYAWVQGKPVAGHCYFKDLSRIEPQQDEAPQ